MPASIENSKLPILQTRRPGGKKMGEEKKKKKRKKKRRFTTSLDYSHPLRSPA